MMSRVCIILISILFVVCANIHAQDASRIPELKADLAKATSDSDRVDALTLLCFSYSIVNTDTAFQYGKKAMELAKKINYAKGIADSYNNIGWTYYRNGDINKAEEYLKTALEKFRVIGNKRYIRVPLANLATLYSDKTEYNKSLDYLREVLRYDEEIGDKTLLGKDLYQVGRLYNILQNYNPAREFFQKSFDYSKIANDEVQMAESLMSIGNTYQFQNDQQKALSYYEQCLKYLQNHKDLYRIGLAHENMAGSFFRLKKYNEAVKNFRLAKENYSKLNSKLDMFYACVGLAEVYNTLGDPINQKALLNEARQYAHQLNDKKLQQDVMANLATFYYKDNNYKSAYDYLDSSYKIKDSLFTLEKQNELLKLQTQFETERKEKENQLLKAQNLATAVQLQQKEILLTASAIGIAMLIVLLYLLYRNRQTKINNITTLRKLNEQLEAQKEEISRINTLLELKALRAQMNPHFIFNCMSSIQECMLTGRLNEANIYLSKLSRLLRMVLVHSDDENITLSKELEMLSLYLELESLRFKGSFQYNIDVAEEIVTEDILVPALILQPFAENAIWHGLLNKPDNRQLNICIQMKQDMLQCIIEDNGIGREKAAQLKSKHSKHDSRGVKLIEKRIDILKHQSQQHDAGIRITDLYNANNEPNGTEVEIILPLITL